jgi:hypothetical protein
MYPTCPAELSSTSQCKRNPYQKKQFSKTNNTHHVCTHSYTALKTKDTKFSTAVVRAPWRAHVMHHACMCAENTSPENNRSNSSIPQYWHPLPIRMGLYILSKVYNWLFSSLFQFHPTRDRQEKSKRPDDSEVLNFVHVCTHTRVELNLVFSIQDYP